MLFNGSGRPQIEEVLDELAKQQLEQQEEARKAKEAGREPPVHKRLLGALFQEHKQKGDCWQRFRERAARKG